MRILVTGGRDYSDEETVFTVLSAFDRSCTFINGKARGLDSIVDSMARYLGFYVEAYPAKWEEHDWTGESGIKCYHAKDKKTCPAAGVRRNQKMIDAGLDLLIAFPGGKGTNDCIDRVKELGKPIMKVGRFKDGNLIT